MRTYVCLPGAWMGAWSWQFVLERLTAAGHDARALPFRGVGERAAELTPDLDNDVFLADTIATLEREDLRDIVLVGHSFGSLIAGLVTDRILNASHISSSSMAASRRMANRSSVASRRRSSPSGRNW